MDRTAWIVVTLCTLGLVYWFTTLPKQQPAAPQVVDARPAAAADGTTPAAVTPAAPGAETPASSPAAPAPAPAAPMVAETTFEQKVGPVEVTFTNLGGGLRKVTLPPHVYSGDEATVLNRDGASAIGSLTGNTGDVADGAYELKSPAGQFPVVFERTTPEGLVIRKTWTPSGTGGAEGFLWKLQLTVKNTGTAAYTGTLGLHAGTASPMRDTDQPTPSVAWNADGDANNEHVGWFKGSGFLGMQFRQPSNLFSRDFGQLLWAGVFSQYYTTLISNTAPEKSLPPGAVWSRKKDIQLGVGEQAHAAQAISAAFGLPAFDLAPGTEKTFDLAVYSGPRAYSILKDVGYRLDEVMFYGWWGFISRKMLWALELFEGWFRFSNASWGLAIILLTVLVRGLMWPLGIKSMRSMKRMSLLAPQMKELQEKYKDNPQKMNTEVMGLYRRYGVNPVSGCLPMLLQIPIFFGLYNMLRAAVELRGHGFWWVNDLSLPDTQGHLFGYAVNPLPIVMAVTMFIQMAMTPKSPDPNMQQQQKIFMLMPFIFLVFCYNFGAALALYWTISNVIGIAQSWIMKRLPEPELKERPGGGAGGLPLPAGGGGGKGGGKPSFAEIFAKRLAEHQKKASKSSLPRTGGSAGSVFKKKDRPSDN